MTNQWRATTPERPSLEMPNSQVLCDWQEGRPISPLCFSQNSLEVFSFRLEFRLGGWPAVCKPGLLPPESLSGDDSPREEGWPGDPDCMTSLA